MIFSIFKRFKEGFVRTQKQLFSGLASIFSKTLIKLLKDAKADKSVLAIKSLEAMEKVANGQSTKIIVPSNLQNLVTTGTILGETVEELLFKSFEINNQYFGFYASLASIIIYILNQTIKPVLTFITLPITVLSMGLFYPIVNVLILYITSFILGKDNFQITGFLAPFFIAIVISLLNIIMEGLVLKPITKGRKKNG